MSTSKEKTQKRILYTCFVILLITAAVAVAVTGAYKKSAKNDTPSVTETEEQTEDAAAAAPDAGKKGGEDKKDETDKKETGIIPVRPKPETTPAESESEPVSLTPEPVSFVSPVSGAVYGEFSDAVPVFSNTMNDYRTHSGVDVSAAIGDPVRACADGVIDEVFEDPMMGQTVRITHADGFESVYRNLSTVLPEGIVKGAAVKAGQTIGAVGDTALIECEDEPHLHFELLLSGAPVDPSLHVVFSPAESDYEG